MQNNYVTTQNTLSGGTRARTLLSRRRHFKSWLTGFSFALPVILGIAIFTYYPAVQSFIWSFTDFNGFTMNFIGIEQFKYMFTVDTEIPRIFANTMIYSLVSVPLGLLLGYFLALAANFKVKGIGVYRLLFYMPVIIPGVASGILYSSILGGNADGAINQIFGSHFKFFLSSDTALFALILMGVWSMGGSMIIWLSAFKNIPDTLYEAAKLDGAGAVQCLVKITLPMSTPMIFYNLVTGIIAALQCTTPLVIDAGSWGAAGRGIDNALYFIATKVYNTAFGGTLSYGYASAVAMVLFVVIGVFTAIIFKTSKWVFYGEE